jgi:MFS family permease
VISVRGTLRNIRTVWARPGTRLGFFTHMGTQFSITVFALMWGIPYLTTAQNMSAGAAGALLSASVVSIIVAGVVIGVLTGRFPTRRSWLVLGIMASNAGIWAVVLLLPGPAPRWLLVVLVLVISVGGPASVVGFDFARTFNPSRSLGTAQGMVNMGGFLVSLLVMQAMGMIIGAMGGYSFDSFRVAWTVQYLVWLMAAIGIVMNRRAALREMARERRSAVVDLEKAVDNR